MDHKIKVLYIDDELINLQAFKSTFRRQFDIYTASSADKGMEVLKEHPIEVVIADQRMPGKTGVDFFESILDVHPNPIRILLTAYTDINAIVDAINKGRVYRYVTKPWSEFDLKLTIENAYQLYLLGEQNNKLNLKYREVFSSSNDPIILFDTTGRIIDYNKATLDLIDDENEALNSSLFSTLIYNKSDADNIIQQFKEKGEVRDYECQIPTKNGNLITCLISGNIITNNYDEIISYQAIVKDITARTKTNQLLLKNTIQIQEQERERISRDLHDGLGQSLIALKLQLEQLKSKNNDIECGQKIDKISGQLGDSINELRKICYDILPPGLREYGLRESVELLGQKLGELNVRANIELNPDLPVLDKDIELALYRIIQEFVNNSLKHSGCNEITIQVFHNNKLSLNLSDNGVGFNYTNEQEGLGINNIISRVKSFNGNIDINSEIGKGTNFAISIPLYNNSNKLYTPNEESEFVQKIDTTTISIGLRKDGLVIIKPQEDFKKTTGLAHAKENMLALATISKNVKRPIVKFIPEYYVNNEAVDYYSEYPVISSATAYIYKSITQQKMAEFLKQNAEADIPINIFNNEEDAINWVKQYINN